MTQDITYVSKGWGFEKIITNTEKYCGKILHFHKGKCCSWHKHFIKDETFFVLSGELEVTFGMTDDITDATTIVLKKGDSLHIPVKLRHKMLAIEETDLLEVSTQDFPEDSIIIIKGD